MDEDVRTCGACKGKASLEGVEEHATDVTYKAYGVVPLGTARIEEGATITYACPCGHRFTFISRLRRSRAIGAFAVPALMALGWLILGHTGRRMLGSGQLSPMDPIYPALAAVFGLVALVALPRIALDAIARARNPPWREG
jgi:hypothetical protein